MAKLKGQLFARLALDYFDHPKIAALSPEAVVAHLEMLVYSRKYLTDGVIPMRIAMRYAMHVHEELQSNDPVNPSVTKNDDGSLILHGYEDFQETRAEVEERRGKRSKAAKARWSGDAPSNASCSAPSNAGSNAETETETETDSNTSSGFANAHPEAATALNYFNNRVKQNGFRKPSDTKANRDAARLMFTRDETPPTQIREVMDWALNDEFWRTNIRSFSKFREKFETMQAQMRRPQQSTQSRMTFDQQRIQANNSLFAEINEQVGGDIWTQDSSPKQIGQ